MTGAKESVQPKLTSFLQAKSGENVTSKRAEIKMCGFLAEHNIPFAVMNHLPDLLKDIFPDSKLIQDFALKPTKAKAIVKNCIGKSQTEILQKKLSCTPFSILIDESTDVANAKVLCIVIRFYDNDEGKIVSRLWDLCEIFNKDKKIDAATAVNLFKIVKDSFEQENVPLDNVLGFGSDGCSTMMGVNNSVSALFRKECPGIYIMKCICHSIHLCASEACKVLSRTCEDLARDIFNYFKSSAKRQSHFREFQEFYDVPILKMLHPSQTRWLSLQAVVDRILNQWEALKAFFIDKKLTDRLTSVEHIVKSLGCPLVHLTFLFLQWVLPKFNNLNKLFQSEKPIIASTYESVCKTYKDLLKCFMTQDYVNRTPVEKIDPSNSEKLLNLENMYLGVEVMSFMQRPEIVRNSKLRSDFFQSCHAFLVVACKQLRSRFDFGCQILQQISLLQPSVRVLEKTRETHPSLLKLMQLLPRIAKKEQYQSIDDEWRNLPSFELPDHIKCNDEIDVFWHKLLVHNYDGIYSFKNLSRFAVMVVSLPHANAECERIFSAVNLAKTHSRNRIVTSTLKALLLTKQRVKTCDKNCVTFEPTTDDFDRMKSTSLYSKNTTVSDRSTGHSLKDLYDREDQEEEEEEKESLVSIIY